MDLFDRFLQERTCLKGVSLPCYTNGSDVHFYPFYNSPPIRCPKRTSDSAPEGPEQVLLSITSRNNPQEDPLAEAIVIFTVEPLFLIWLPITHIERVRHDPRTGLQILQQLRAETHVDLGQKK